MHKLGAEGTLDFRKPENTSNTIITQAYQSKCSSWRPTESLETFLNLFIIRIKQGKVRKSDPSEIGFPMALTSGVFLNQKPINKPSMNNLRILLAAVCHFVYPVGKDSWKHDKVTYGWSTKCQFLQDLMWHLTSAYMKCVYGWLGVRYVITKISRMDSLPNFLPHGAP